MPKHTSYSLPKEGVSREVLEADLPYYLGRDARILDSDDRDRYVIEAALSPPKSMLPSLRGDTARWENHSRGRRMSYSDSSIHQDRKRSCTGTSEPRRQPVRHDPHGSSAGTVYPTQPLAVPQRPAVPQRYSTNGSSGTDFMPGSPSSMFGSPSDQNGRSYLPSSGYPSSRRPSDAFSSLDSNMITRTSSVSSESSSYGTNGTYGWRTDNDDYGTNGVYGWKDRAPPSSYNDRRM
ncbi:hypothetical protein EDD36DRAFT_45560 [Exophiala viscosa]|uniref:Uncharacterized protein n=1 Tax=Exophiala viscosa TaxID=2486360 RepID=A0AAN6E6P4_9EURO|nr:hypothetical protein EDD36DRAFT_45560 [Exophiala viscosa]